MIVNDAEPAPIEDDPEKQLQKFLAAQPLWLQKVLQLNMDALSTNEIQEWTQPDNWNEWIWHKCPEYERIVRKIPAQWRQYRRKLKRLALSGLPKGQEGAPKKDAVAREALALREAGRTNPQIADILAKKYGTPKTPDAVRKLIASRSTPKPEKN